MFYAVLSPAKSLDFESAVPSFVDESKPVFDKETKLLISQLAAKKPSEIAALMDLSDKLTALNVERYKHFYTQSTRPALFAFIGDVYKGLDVKTLNEKALKNAHAHVGILSGLYGFLRAFDGIRPHRLEMGTNLKTEQGKNLYEFWGDRVTHAVQDHMKAVGASCLLNLASNEYAGVLNKKVFGDGLIDIDFKEQKGNQPPKTIGIHAKRARGLMARYLLENTPPNESHLKKFATDGYCFSSDESRDNYYVFIRKH